MGLVPASVGWALSPPCCPLGCAAAPWRPSARSCAASSRAGALAWLIAPLAYANLLAASLLGTALLLVGFRVARARSGGVRN